MGKTWFVRVLQSQTKSQKTKRGGERSRKTTERSKVKVTFKIPLQVKVKITLQIQIQREGKI